MELRVAKFKLYVQAFFDADFHFNRWVNFRLGHGVVDVELLFLGDSIVVPIYNNVDEVS